MISNNCCKEQTRATPISDRRGTRVNKHRDQMAAWSPGYFIMTAMIAQNIDFSAFFERAQQLIYSRLRTKLLADQETSRSAQLSARVFAKLSELMLRKT